MMAKDVRKAMAFAPKLQAIVETQMVVACSPELSTSEKAAKSKLAALVRDLTDEERRALATFGKAMIGLAGYL